MKVVVLNASFPEFAEEIRAAKEQGAEIEILSGIADDGVVDAVHGASVVLLQFTKFGADALRVLAPSATVVRYGVGYDNIDLEAARELGVRVAYVPDYCTDEVADHTVAMILALQRRLPGFDRDLRSGRWTISAGDTPIKPLAESVVGFLGFGRIAQAVKARLVPFGPTFIASDPRPEQFDQADVRPVPVPVLLAESDILTLHAPADSSTRKLVNRERLEAMKPTAILVNTARGDLIDTHALAEALDERPLFSAGLDVFEMEPLPDAHPLIARRNALLTPHTAWFSQSSLPRLQRLAADEVRRALRGEAPKHEVHVAA